MGWILFKKVLFWAFIIVWGQTIIHFLAYVVVYGTVALALMALLFVWWIFDKVTGWFR